MSEEERVNAADPKQVREKGLKEKRADQQQDDDLRTLLELPAGRRFLARLIFDDCALLETSYHSSGQLFAHNEGRRGVGSQLQGEIMKASLEGWCTLLRERFVKP